MEHVKIFLLAMGAGIAFAVAVVGLSSSVLLFAITVLERALG